MGKTEDWSPPEGAWQLKLTQIGVKWVWELIYHAPDAAPGGYDLVDYGSCRTRQRAINLAAVARIRYTKKHLPRREETIDL